MGMLMRMLLLPQGTVNLAHEFMPVLAMTAKVKNLLKPSFMVVNSFGAVVPLKYMSAYCASKYALHGFTECLRMEADAMGVHVGTVHPGVVNTNFMERAKFVGANAEEDRRTMQQVLKSPMAQRPEDVAQAVWDSATGNAFFCIPHIPNLACAFVSVFFYCVSEASSRVAGYRNEMVVGPFYYSGLTMHRMTGINPTQFLNREPARNQS
jgi:short-subunit dehydrogenase